MTDTDKPLIFISCGQYAKHERDLGEDIRKLIEEIRPDLEPYLAQDQSTVDGLSDNILKAPHSAAGLICVMHERGKVQGGKDVVTRGSVWIEQEIAIAAFMTHALEREIPILFYKTPKVSLEGIRQVLGLNPRLEFTDEQEVLDDLRGVLPGKQFKPFAELDLEPRLYFQRQPISGRAAPEEQYCFRVELENVGTAAVTDYCVEIYFPRRWLPVNHGLAFNASKSDSTHICLEFDDSKKLREGQKLYRGQSIRICSFSYPMPGDLDDDVRVVVWSGNMKPKTVVRRISGLPSA